ncbi:MAG: hypothetical protein JXA69_10265 [Phycisphaerae bacterium]|nr:hypothetical protein [Phycisphaerae bacterium]
MVRKQIRQFGAAIPVVILPLMDVSITEFPDWLAGNEFKTLLSQLLSQVFSGIFNGFLGLLINALFGVTV